MRRVGEADHRNVASTHYKLSPLHYMMMIIAVVVGVGFPGRLEVLDVIDVTPCARFPYRLDTHNYPHLVCVDFRDQV